MHDDRSHPLLQQVPLTVSPFVNLPTATTLPYRYKPMPSTLPPSMLETAPAPLPPAGDPGPAGPDGAHAGGPTAAGAPAATAAQARYVVSPSGHAAHPDEILASCRALREHVTRLVERAERDLAEVTERIRARDLAEKRRLAPGWLDSDARLLEPERPASAGAGPGASPGAGAVPGGSGSGGGGGGGGGAGGGEGDGKRERPGEMLLQQPVQGLGGLPTGYGEGHGSGHGHGHGLGGASEMAVPDEGEQLDRVFGSLSIRSPKP